MRNILYSEQGYYCTECKSICHIYEQDLTCNCGQPWESEVHYIEDYPKKWIKVLIEAISLIPKISWIDVRREELKQGLKL